MTSGLLAAVIAGQRRQLRLQPTLAALAPALVAISAAINLANFLSGDAFGAPTSLPWAIWLWGAARHPTQLYELAAALAVWALIWWGPFRADRRGLNFVIGVAGLAASRLVFEAVRGDSVIWAGGWRAAQLGALAILGAALVWLRRWARAANAGNPE